MTPRKLTALLATCAALSACLAAVALAGPVVVANYPFTSVGDVQAFQKVKGQKCTKGHRKARAMGVGVGTKTNACAFRSSVIGDSSGGANLQIRADVNMAAKTPQNLQKKIYLAVSTRMDGASGYELRVYPTLRLWQVVRDPAGSGLPKVIAKGTGKKFIRLGTGKVNTLTLRAFAETGASVRLLAKVNNRTVLSKLDTAPALPTGRQASVGIGAKGSAAARGAVGSFDNVTIAVPDPNT